MVKTRFLQTGEQEERMQSRLKSSTKRSRKYGLTQGDNLNPIKKLVEQWQSRESQEMRDNFEISESTLAPSNQSDRGYLHILI
jgi:hypothetical protein